MARRRTSLLIGIGLWISLTLVGSAPTAAASTEALNPPAVALVLPVPKPTLCTACIVDPPDPTLPPVPKPTLCTACIVDPPDPTLPPVPKPTLCTACIVDPPDPTLPPVPKPTLCTACIVDPPDPTLPPVPKPTLPPVPKPTLPPVPKPTLCTTCIVDPPDPTLPPVPKPTVPPVSKPTLPPVPDPTLPPVPVPSVCATCVDPTPLLTAVPEIELGDPVSTLDGAISTDDGSGAGGVQFDPTYVPPVPTAGQVAAIAAKLQVQTESEPFDAALLATSALDPALTDSDYVQEYQSCPESPCGGGGSTAPSSGKVRMGFYAQERNYWCVPATTQNILYGIRGLRYAQADLARYEGTRNPNPKTHDPGGTDPRKMAPLLNANDNNANTYQALTATEVHSSTNLFSRVVTNVYRYRVGTGFTGDPALMPWSSDPTNAGKFSHELALYGYASGNGGTLYVSEPFNAKHQQAFSPAQGWSSMKGDKFSQGILTW